MAERPLSPETLDSTLHHTDEDDSSNQSSSSDPSLLSRNSSFSRLNAKAPEFVPRVPAPTDPNQTQLQRPLVVHPAPPPSGLVRVFSPPPDPPFHIPVQAPLPVLVQNPHHHHHHHPQYRPHHQTPYYGGLSDTDGVDSAQKLSSDPDHASPSSNGLPEEAIQKILNQVEYYFSDLNLATTDHLMRFINKDPEGYVPLSVVAAFKKIKSFTSSHSQLAGVLQNSRKLVVSEDGKKVRRQHPLTESDMEELQSRIIVAENLPEDHCYQNLLKIFSVVGSVKTIRTCQPQTSSGGGSSASRSAKADNMFFSNKLHAFVEYETAELAEKAVAELNGKGNWRSSLRVRLLHRHTPPKPNQARVKKGNEGEGSCKENDASIAEQQPSENVSEEPSQHSDGHCHGHAGEEHSNDREGGLRKGRNRGGRGKGRGRPQSHHNNNNRGGPVGTPPSVGLAHTEQAAIAKQPPGPRMPDGTRGFAMGRGKPVSVNTA